MYGFPPVKMFSGAEVKALRGVLAKRVGFSRPISQGDLADIMGVTKSIIYAWEHDRKRPSGSACRLMQILEAVPQAGWLLLPKHGAWRKLLAQQTEVKE